MKKTRPLSENYLFRRLYRRGPGNVTSCVALYMGKNSLGYNRLGIATSKKIGNAVQRNRARRVIMEAYRLMEESMPTGVDIVIAARQRAAHVKMQEVQRSLRQAFGQGKKTI